MARTTTVERLYGPRPDDWRMRLVERLWWRDPYDLLDLVHWIAGVASLAIAIRVSPMDPDCPPVAPGHVVAFARRDG